MSLAVKARRKKAAAPDHTALLLAWYDRHRRVLPWRARSGERADPYRVWLSEIMLQQTTVKAVAPYYARFLAALSDRRAARRRAARRRAEAVGRARLLRARPQPACLRAGRGGAARRPISRHRRRSCATLPGIGAYTAAAIAAIAFDRRASPVDGNIERVIARLFAIEEELPGAKPRIRALAGSLTPAQRAGDFAQAMMDLGATICTPKTPACVLCPWSDACAARARGDQETLSAQGRRRRPASCGAAPRSWRCAPTASSCCARGPQKGLLGGMTEVPTTRMVAWLRCRRARSTRRAVSATPHGAACRASSRTPSRIFRSSLRSMRAQVPARTRAPRGTRWVRLAELPARRCRA